MRHGIRGTITTFVLATLVLVACAPGEDTEEAEEEAPSEIETDVAAMGDVTLTVWDQQVRGGQAESIEALNAAFEEQNPNITIDRVARSYEDLQKTLRLAIGGDDAPDVVQVNNARGEMGAFVESNLIRSLNSYSEVYGWTDRYPEAIRATAMYSDDGTVFGEGSLYGLAQTGELIGIWYNKAKLDQLGIEPPQTFADFEAALQTAKDAGEIPIQFGNKEQWPGNHTFGFVQNMFVDREEIRDLGYGREGGDWTDEANVQAAERLQEWVDAGYFPDGFNGIDYDPSWQDFANGQGVFMISGSWLLADLQATLGDDLGFVLPPVGKTGERAVTGATVLPFSITNNADEPDAAAAYLNFITSPEAMQTLAEAGELPVVEADQQQVSGPLADVFNAWSMANAEDALVPYVDWSTAEALTLMPQEIQTYLGGDSSTEEFLGTLQDDREAFLEENTGG